MCYLSDEPPILSRYILENHAAPFLSLGLPGLQLGDDLG